MSDSKEVIRLSGRNSEELIGNYAEVMLKNANELIVQHENRNKSSFEKVSERVKPLFSEILIEEDPIENILANVNLDKEITKEDLIDVLRMSRELGTDEALKDFADARYF